MESPASAGRKGNTIMVIGIIGAGRVGCSLGKYLSESGVKSAGFYDISKEAADSAAQFTSTDSFSDLKDLAAQSNLLFLTTPDDIILKVWETLRRLPLEQKIICHCSGAMPSSAFVGIEDTGACGCSLHPMLPFNSRFSSYEQLKHSFFTIEGEESAVQAVSSLFTRLGNTVCRIDGNCKPRYHAAASILSNQVAAVLDTGYRLLEECGFTREEAVQASARLVRQNIENILLNDCVKALTGPIERNDIHTVQKHLDCLNEEDCRMYQILGLKLVQIAQKKNPVCDYDGLIDLLGGRHK